MAVKEWIFLSEPFFLSNFIATYFLKFFLLLIEDSGFSLILFFSYHNFFSFTFLMMKITFCSSFFPFFHSILRFGRSKNPFMLWGFLHSFWLSACFSFDTHNGSLRVLGPFIFSSPINLLLFSPSILMLFWSYHYLLLIDKCASSLFLQVKCEQELRDGWCWSRSLRENSHKLKLETFSLRKKSETKRVQNEWVPSPHSRLPLFKETWKLSTLSFYPLSNFSSSNGRSSRARPHSMENFHVSCPHLIDRYPEFHHQTSLNVIHAARPSVFAVSPDWTAACGPAADANVDDSFGPWRSSSSEAYCNYCQSSEVHAAATWSRRPTSNVWVLAVSFAVSRQILAVAFDACYDGGRELLPDRF